MYGSGCLCVHVIDVTLADENAILMPIDKVDRTILGVGQCGDAIGAT